MDELSSGQGNVVRFVIKPTSLILTARQPIHMDGCVIEVVTRGRHASSVGIAAASVN